MALAVHIGEKWVFRGVLQHWWSFAGDDDRTIDTSVGPVTVKRSEVNLTDFQYILRYRLTTETSIGCAPSIRYNGEIDQLDLPVGIGVDHLFQIGKLPLKLGTEVNYYVERSDDFGPQWSLSFSLSTIVPAPEWSRKALF